MGTDELSIWMTDGLGKEFRCCFIIITSCSLFKFEDNAKNCQHSSQGQSLDLRGRVLAKAKATGPEAKAKAKRP